MSKDDSLPEEDEGKEKGKKKDKKKQKLMLILINKELKKNEKS